MEVVLGKGAAPVELAGRGVAEQLVCCIGGIAPCSVVVAVSPDEVVAIEAAALVQVDVEESCGGGERCADKSVRDALAHEEFVLPCHVFIGVVNGLVGPCAAAGGGPGGEELLDEGQFVRVCAGSVIDYGL